MIDSKEMLSCLLVISSLLSNSIAQTEISTELTGLSFGCGNVTLSCSGDLLLVVERVSYTPGSNCQQNNDWNSEQHFPVQESSSKFVPSRQHQQNQQKKLQEFAESLARDSVARQQQKQERERVENARDDLLPYFQPLISIASANFSSGGKLYQIENTTASALTNQRLDNVGASGEDPDTDIEIWDSLVTECAGYKRQSCRFQVANHLPDISSSGRLEVQYTCAKNIYSYCGGDVKAENTGYIASPGYPKYYLVKFLIDPGNVSVITTKIKLEDQPFSQVPKSPLGVLPLESTMEKLFLTEDCIEITENGDLLERSCGKLVEVKHILSKTNTLEIRTVNAPSNLQLKSRRGILLRYKTIGCAIPERIADGQVVAANGSYAEFSCNEGHVFKSNLLPVRSLSCSGTHWNGAIEHCVSIEFLLQYGDDAVKEKLQAVQYKHSQLTAQQSLSGYELNVELAALILVGILLLSSMTIALVVYMKFTESGSYYVQDDDEDVSMKEILTTPSHQKSERY